MDIESICIFCGSSTGEHPDYTDRAADVGRLFAERGVRIVYGGGSVGLMGAVADAALEAGGEVVGVIPNGLAARERMHAGVTQMLRVDTMHERKARMNDLSDAFLALPGGMGTLEEFCEIFTWGQLGIHEKPFGMLNVRGYFDGFAGFLDHMVDEGFFREDHRDLVVIGDDAEELLREFQAYEPAHRRIWLVDQDL